MSFDTNKIFMKLTEWYVIVGLTISTYDLIENYDVHTPDYIPTYKIVRANFDGMGGEDMLIKTRNKQRFYITFDPMYVPLESIDDTLYKVNNYSKLRLLSFKDSDNDSPDSLWWK